MKLVVTLLYLIPSIAIADAAVVVDATAQKSGASWTFHVSIKHTDTGWEHYADGWGIYTPDGTELGFRELAHPHVYEQPLTRSLSGIKISDGLTQIIIKPRDLVHGVGQDYILTLP